VVVKFRVWLPLVENAIKCNESIITDFDNFFFFVPFIIKTKISTSYFQVKFGRSGFPAKRTRGIIMASWRGSEATAKKWKDLDKTGEPGKTELANLSSGGEFPGGLMRRKSLERFGMRLIKTWSAVYTEALGQCSDVFVCGQSCDNARHISPVAQEGRLPGPVRPDPARSLYAARPQSQLHRPLYRSSPLSPADSLLLLH